MILKNLKGFFKKIQKQKDFRQVFIGKLIEHKLFAPIAIAIITVFILFNGFSYLKDYIEERQELADRSYLPIKVNLANINLLSKFNEEQNAEYIVKAGDTMSKILFDFGVSDTDIFSILNAIRKVYNPTSLGSGQKILLKYKINIGYKDQKELKQAEIKDAAQTIARNAIINNIKISPDLESEIIIVRNDDGSYSAKKNIKILTKYIVKYSGMIENSLFEDGVDIGVSPNIMINMINLYSFDVDFQRDIRSGDKFEILFESYYDKDGRKVKDGNILFSSLVLKDKPIDIYMKKTGNAVEYFDAKGNSVRKSLLRTPINGARISSGFGIRRHPILGYSKMHKGVDFAAPKGTPILAAGNGVITYYGRKGGYGNFVQIKHNSSYSTGYGHASRFAKKLRVGSKVKQGQVVAYVGSTGRSTGPHLHYEIIYKGKQINPSKVKAVSGVRLGGKELERFKAVKYDIDLQRKNTPNQNNEIKN